MAANPFFSIVVPVYKVEKYLPQCVDSLLAQDFDSYEIILVDDGSPDNCPWICDGYSRKSDRIRVIHKQNGGLSDARNAGISVSRGDYVTFVDSDDFWLGTDVLSKLYRAVTDNERPDVIASDFIKYFEDDDRYVYPSSTGKFLRKLDSKTDILRYLYYELGDMRMSAWQKVVKREFLDRFRFEKGLLSEDIDWSLALYPHVKTICLLSSPYYCYRQQRAGSITNSASVRAFDSLIHIVEKWDRNLSEMKLPAVESEIYRGYLANQLSIAMTRYPRLDRQDRKRALLKIKDNIHLFSGSLNFKTRKVRKLAGIAGIRNTCRILALFVRSRQFLKKG